MGQESDTIPPCTNAIQAPQQHKSAKCGWVEIIMPAGSAEGANTRKAPARPVAVISASARPAAVTRLSTAQQYDMLGARIGQYVDSSVGQLA
jgi:hypothetical protein